MFRDRDQWYALQIVCDLGMLLFSYSSSIQGKKAPKQYLLPVNITWKNISTMCENEYVAISDLHSC